MRAVAVLLVLLAAMVGGPVAHADAPGPRRHEAFLPQASAVGARGIAAGRLPGASYPSGTVVLGWSLEGLGPSLTEWDLSRARVVRQSVLGWPQGGTQLVGTRDALHVLADGDHVRYARVDASSLRTACQVDLGDGVAGALASDGRLTAIAWTVHALGHADEQHVALLDDACRRRADLVSPVPAGATSGMGLAVMAGHAYGVVPDAQPRVLAIAPDGTVERSLALDGPSPRAIVAAGSRLLLLGGGEAIALSGRLEVLSRRAVRSGSAGVAVADDGRALTTDGVVLSPQLAVVGRFQPSQMSPIAALWVGAVPVILATDPLPLKHVSLAWVDPGAPELGAAPAGP